MQQVINVEKNALKVIIKVNVGVFVDDAVQVLVWTQLFGWYRIF